MTDVIEVSTSVEVIETTQGEIEIVEVGIGGGVTSYNDLTDLPTLGTAATTASTDYATAAQGGLADSAMQPGDDAADLGSGAATDNYVLTADGIGGAAWEAAAVTYAGAANEIHAATSKTTPVDADELGLADSAASYVLKKLTWANLKTTLSSVFAVLAGKSGGQTLIGGTGATDSLVLQSTSGVGATGAQIRLNVGNNGATNALTVLNDGSVGIGTTSPGAKLSVTGIGTGAGLAFQVADSTNSQKFTVSDNGNITINNKITAPGYIDFYGSSIRANTTYGMGAARFAAISSGGRVSFNDSVSSIVGEQKLSFSADINTYWNLPAANTQAWATYNVERMRIDNNGNVGIGTTAPVALVHAISNTEQLRIGYDATYYASFTINSSGALTQTAIAGQTFIGGTGVTSKVTVQGTSGNGTSTAAAFEVKVGNNGNITAMYIRNDGNIYLPGPIENTTSGEGIVLKSPDGTRYKLTVANGGTISIAAA